MSNKTSSLTLRRKHRKGRKIQTVYYFGTTVVKRNTAKYSNTAVVACVNHMQFNSYDATHAEVFDSEDGTLHAVIKSALVRGKYEIHILFKREVQKEQ